MKNVKESFSLSQEMYWLRSVGRWINQFSASDDVQTVKVEARNVQGFLVNNKRKRHHVKKKKKKAKLVQLEVQRKKLNTCQKTLFICKLSSETNEIILQEFFQQFGEISKLKLIRNSRTGRSRCYAFIEYDDQVSCDKAYSDSRETDFIVNNVKVLVDHVRCTAET